MVTLELPFPPTSNHTNGIGRRKNGKAYIYSKDNLVAFKREAHGMYQQQKDKAGKPILGNFTYHVTLDESQRSTAGDGQNRTKYAIDICEDLGLVTDDGLADGGSWSWGPVKGAFVRLYPVGVQER